MAQPSCPRSPVSNPSISGMPCWCAATLCAEVVQKARHQLSHGQPSTVHQAIHRYRRTHPRRTQPARQTAANPDVCCRLLAAEQQVSHELNVAPASVLFVFGNTPPAATWHESTALGRRAGGGQRVLPEPGWTIRGMPVLLTRIAAIENAAETSRRIRGLGVIVMAFPGIGARGCGRRVWGSRCRRSGR